MPEPKPTAPGRPQGAARLLECVRKLPAAAPLLALAPEYPLHLVGGSVRDLLCGRTPRELDLAVEGDPLAIARALGGRITVHDRFGTCTVLRDGERYDIARTRRERYPHPGALPEVEPAGLDEDLRRRDFTVNAIALSLAGTAPGRLRAAPGALHDLSRRLLRILHERSFQDDPTRLLRLARYTSRLGFETEPRTRELALAAVASGALQTVNATRIGAELRLLAREEDPLRAMEQLAALGADRAVLGPLRSPQRSLARRALELLPGDGCPGLLVLAVAAAGASTTPAQLRARLKQLGFPAGERDVILAAATRAEDLAGQLSRAAGPAQVAAAARGAPVELVALAGAAGQKQAREAAREWLERLRHVRLEISGDDLLAAGQRPGPQIGAMLRAALTAKLEGRASGREQELAAALDCAGDGGSARPDRE